MTGGSTCTLAVTLFHTDNVPIDPYDPLSCDMSMPAGVVYPMPAARHIAHGDDSYGDHQDYEGPYAAHDGGYGEGSDDSGLRRVVLAHISSLAQPEALPLGGLTIDSLHSVFSQFGPIEKIACTTNPKTGSPLQSIDVMVQFAAGGHAAASVHALDGASLTNDGYYRTQAKFSKHTELRTHGNSERTRVYVGAGAHPAAHSGLDYGAPVGAGPRLGPLGAAPSAIGKRPRIGEPVGAAHSMHDAKRYRAEGGPGEGHEWRRVVLAHISDLTNPGVAPMGGLSVDDIHVVFSPHGFIEKIACKASPKTGPPVECVDAMIQFQSPSAAASALQLLDGTSLTNDSCNRLQCKWSKHNELTAQGDSEFHRDYTSGAHGGGEAMHLQLGGPRGPAGPPIGAARDIREMRGAISPAAAGVEAPTPVAAVFNLPEEMADADILFNLFSLYGYVSIVKVVFKRPRDTALVQFSEAGFVDLAIERLAGATLMGRPLEIRRSKQGSIRCTEMDQNSLERTTRSYTMQDQFWSKKEYEKIWDNAACPSRTLFIKNIAPQLSDRDLTTIFGQHGTVQDFAFLPCPVTARYKTAAVQMATIPESVQAVALVQRERFQNMETGEEMRLLVNFSKKDEMPRNAVRGAVGA